jgi:hypothetical protein
VFVGFLFKSVGMFRDVDIGRKENQYFHRWMGEKEDIRYA